MKIDLKITFADGETIESNDWPDQPIRKLFEDIIRLFGDVVDIQVTKFKVGT